MSRKEDPAGTTLDGSVPPIYEDPEYPELLRDLARVVQTGLIEAGLDPERAGLIAENIAEHARTEYGGVPQYWPKGDTWRVRKRRAELWDAFNGKNHAVLAKTFGMSLSQVYRALAVAKAEWKNRNIGDLFAAKGEEKAS